MESSLNIQKIVKPSFAVIGIVEDSLGVRHCSNHRWNGNFRQVIATFEHVFQQLQMSRALGKCRFELLAVFKSGNGIEDSGAAL